MLARRRVVEELLRERGDALVVTGLGGTTWDTAAASDHSHNFYLWGAMGGAAMVGLGLALARPERRVLVVTGDGEMLMGLGSLATIGVQRPANLAVVVIDNERFGETGMQLTHTKSGVDLARIAEACGFPATVTVRRESELASTARRVHRKRGPVFVVFKVKPDREPMVLPERRGIVLKEQFRAATLKPDGDDGR